MTKKIEDFKGVVIPRDRVARQQLLASTFNDGYWAGKADKAHEMAEESRKVSLANREAEAKQRGRAVDAMASIGEALAKTAQALADIVEPRRV